MISVVLEQTHVAACANCATVLEGKFCHGCGQNAHLHKSLLHLGEEVLHGVLHFDAKGLRTVPMLAMRPGKMTRMYIDGHRARYVSPLALFLFKVFTMFFVGSLTGGKVAQSVSDAPHVVLDVKNQSSAEVVAGKAKVAKAQAALATARATGDDVAKAQEAVDGALEELGSTEQVLVVAQDAASYVGSPSTGWKAAAKALIHAAANRNLTLYKLKSKGSQFSFLLVPITLPVLWLLFCRRRDVTLYDHAVFALYSLSFMSLMFSLVFVLRFAG